MLFGHTIAPENAFYLKYAIPFRQPTSPVNTTEDGCLILLVMRKPRVLFIVVQYMAVSSCHPSRQWTRLVGAIADVYEVWPRLKRNDEGQHNAILVDMKVAGWVLTGDVTISMLLGLVLSCQLAPALANTQ